MMQSAKRRLKSVLLNRWNLPYSSIPHLPPSVYRVFRSRRGVTVVDVGAHVGDFSAGMAELCGLKACVLVEPLPNCVQVLRSATSLAGAQIFDCAVGESAGSVTFNLYPDAPYVSSMLTLDRSIEGLDEFAGAAATPLEVQLRTLDDIAAEAGLGEIDLLKIDVQGAELSALRGASTVLGKTRYVYLEVSFRPLYEGSCVFAEVYAALTAAGFKLIDLEPGFRSPSGELLQADALFQRDR